MKSRKFTFISDPGHGWLKVSRADLLKYDVAHLISGYSYMRNNHVYLEEDIDAATFIRAVEATGVKVLFNEVSSNKQSKIRNYTGFTIATFDFEQLWPVRV